MSAKVKAGNWFSATTTTSKYKIQVNKCRIKVDIMTGEKLSSIYVANMDIIYWTVRSSITRGWGRGDG